MLYSITLTYYKSTYFTSSLCQYTKFFLGVIFLIIIDSRTAQNFLLAIPLPHAKLLALPSAGGRDCQTPFWARTMLHIGSDEGNSCHTGEINEFKGVCFAMCPDLSN